MQILERYYKYNLKYNFLNKFKYNSIKKIPKLKKIVLTFKNKMPSLKLVILSLLAFEFITNIKNVRILSVKKPNLMLKIKKGNPIGCKIILRKNNIFKFLNKLIFNILIIFNSLKNINVKKFSTHNNSYTFSIQNIMFFKKIRHFFNVFSNIGNLNLAIIFEQNTFKNSILFSLKSLFLIKKC